MLLTMNTVQCSLIDPEFAFALTKFSMFTNNETSKGQIESKPAMHCHCGFAAGNLRSVGNLRLAGNLRPAGNYHMAVYFHMANNLRTAAPTICVLPAICGIVVYNI
jgi:hypothetical protein